MKKYNYTGVDKIGRTVNGSTLAASEEEVKKQLVQFGFKNIRIKAEEAASAEIPPTEVQEQPPDDFVQKLIDGDIQIEEPVSEEEAELYEWERAEAFTRIRHHRRRENIALAITLVVIGIIAAYFIFNKLTEIPAPQPEIITRSASEMLSFKDVYVKGQDLVFVVFSRDWNGNVRVDFKAWDPVDKKNPVDFGTARLGFIGDHYGGSPQKSGTFKLKKTRFYDRIEIIVSGDEKR